VVCQCCVYVLACHWGLRFVVWSASFLLCGGLSICVGDCIYVVVSRIFVILVGVHCWNVLYLCVCVCVRLSLCCCFVSL